MLCSLLHQPKLHSFMADAASSSRQLKYQVFLSFRGPDTRLGFTSHLLEALKGKGLDVFFDEEKLERGDRITPALSQAIAASNLSIIVLSKDYASSNSCLAELSDIMDRNRTQSHGHIVIPIFYKVHPSDVRHLGGNFKTSFDLHESEGIKHVKQWKDAFTEVGKIIGWHIKGDEPDRSEAEYIKDIVGDVIRKLMNGKSRSSEQLVGIDDQKKMILDLIEQQDCRVIGLWGAGGIGKTTLADAVYKEVSTKFQGCCFLQNVREKIENQGRESLRNELLSKLLEQKDVCIDTLSIGTPYLERLNNKQVIVVLDDVSDPDHKDFMGVRHFGHGSKIIVTSRDRQVLKNGGADKIHEVDKLNKNDSLQLFSTMAFKQLNPVADFRDLSNKFVEYAQGSPLALKVLGSKLYTKSKREWESEVTRLKEYAESKISQILKSSFDGLDEVEKNIFLDIAIFFKGEPKTDVEEVLNCCYKAAVSGINNLVDKCLLSSLLSYYITMHDMLEEMGKDIVRQESKDPRKRSRLWLPKDVYQVLKYDKGTDLIEGIKLDMTQIDNLNLSSTVFEKMHNLKYIHFSVPRHLQVNWNEKLLVDHRVDSVFLPDELRYLCWEYYPFKSLSSSFNPKNLVVLKLQYGNMEQLWNEDDYLDLSNLREIDLLYCKKLRKVPILSRAIKLEKLCLQGCESLIELPCLNHLSSLNYQWFELEECCNLNKFPDVPNNFLYLKLKETGIEEVPDSIEHLVELALLYLSNSRVQYVSNNISKLESLEWLDLSHCPVTEFPEIPRRLRHLNLSGTQIKEVTLSFYFLCSLRYLYMSSSSIQMLQCNVSLSGSIAIPTVDVPSPILRSKSLGSLVMNHCESLELLSELPPYLWLLDLHGCTSLEYVSFVDQNLYRYHSSNVDEDQDDDDYDLDLIFMLFSDCFSLNQDSIDNIEANAMLNIVSLADKAPGYDWGISPEWTPRLICCFPGNKISASKFEYQSVNSWIDLEIDSDGCSGRRFLGFVVCLVADLTPCHDFFTLKYLCDYQLTAAGGDVYETFETELYYLQEDELDRKCIGDHVLILSSLEMVIEDKNYEEASFEFSIISYKFSVDEETEFNYIKVKKCGVHVFYVDAESDTYSDWMSNDEADDSFSSGEYENTEDYVVESSESFNSDEVSNDESNRNMDSREDANVEQVHAGVATETRHGDKRRFGYDAVEEDAEPKRLK